MENKLLYIALGFIAFMVLMMAIGDKQHKQSHKELTETYKNRGN